MSLQTKNWNLILNFGIMMNLITLAALQAGIICISIKISSLCAAGWYYPKWNHCGFGGCQNICQQPYNCYTPGPTGIPTRSPTGSPNTTNYVVVFHYDYVYRTLQIDGYYDSDYVFRPNCKILCIENNKLALCEENSNSQTIRWKFKTREEAFPHDSGIIGEYYIFK